MINGKIKAMISAVIPLYNEEESIVILHQRLLKELPKIDKNFEILFIDDGSTDVSLEKLKKIASLNKRVRVFSFRKNQGKAEALTLGFTKAKGDYIVTLDADLQDRPEEIHKLFAKIKDYDVVCGWRYNRKDSSRIKFASKLFNLAMGKIWGIRLHDYNCGLKLYSQDAAKSLRLYGGMYRFIPLLSFQNGFRITEVAIEHDKRMFGKSKYGFGKLWRNMPDMLTILFIIRYAKRPLHFFATFGGLLAVTGITILGYLTYLHYFLGQSVGTRPLLSISILFILIGVQVFFTGFLADLITNVYQQSDFAEAKDSHNYLLKYQS